MYHLVSTLHLHDKPGWKSYAHVTLSTNVSRSFYLTLSDIKIFILT